MLQIQPANSSTSIISKSAIYEQPLDLLLSCHTKIKHFSSALCTLVRAIQQDGWNNHYITSVEQVRRYFNVASLEHHQDEEEHLFPAIIALKDKSIIKNNKKITDLIQKLIKEHHDSDVLWSQLDKMLANHSEDFLTLNTLCQQFETDMHNHAQIEDDIIFPYAKKHLSKEVFKKMGLAIAHRRGINI